MFFFLHDCCTHGELLEIGEEDYDLEKIEMVKLTYFLPNLMLQEMAPDTLHMHVTNDRQVWNLIELSKTHILCLCVSSQCQK